MVSSTHMKALEIGYKIFHRKHFYPGKDTEQVIEAELKKILPARDSKGRFTKPSVKKED